MNNLLPKMPGDASEDKANTTIKEQQISTNNHLTSGIQLQLMQTTDSGNFIHMPIWARRRGYQVCITPRSYLATVKLRIHDEVMDLYGWIKPTVEEVLLRRFVFNRVCKVLSPLFRPSQIGVFGSVATNLFLPTSDIDIAIASPNHCEEKLNAVVELLRIANDFEGVNAIGQTKVPIVKFIHKKTGFNLDISFNTSKGLNRTLQWIQRQKREYPVIEPLVLILKRFLAQCGPSFSEPYYGGLSSYALVVMIVHFIEHASPKGRGRKLGWCLIEFFKYFGEVFDYKQCLSCAGRGITCTRKKMRPFQTSLQASLTCEINSCFEPLWVQDPTDIGELHMLSLALLDVNTSIVEKMFLDNNVAAACYNISLIRTAFAKSYHAVDQALRFCQQVDESNIRDYYSGPMLTIAYQFTDEEISRRQQCIDYLRSGACKLSDIC